MAGYSVVFDTVFDGSLHGKWPQLPVWISLLAMADKNGLIDRSYRAIASDLGVDEDTLRACIEEFCGPDPDSRTRENEGRRLELIDPERPWGWRVINHAKYRERARKSAYDAARTASGQDAERKKAERAAVAGDVPTRPDASRALPLSNSKQQTANNKHTERAREPENPEPDETDELLGVPRGTWRKTFEKCKALYPAGTHRESDWLRAERAIYRSLEAGANPADVIGGTGAFAIQQRALGRVPRYVPKPSSYFEAEDWRSAVVMPPTAEPDPVDAKMAADLWPAVRYHIGGGPLSLDNQAQRARALAALNRMGGARTLGQRKSDQIDRLRDTFIREFTSVESASPALQAVG